MTDAERRLRAALRQNQVDGARFRRQAPIGRYVADFVCLEHRLIVELDGGQHADPAEQDRQRTEWLESQGFHVLRFWNNEVLENLEGVVFAIQQELSLRRPD